MPDNLEHRSQPPKQLSNQEQKIEQNSFTAQECRNWIQNLATELQKSPSKRSTLVVGNCLYVLAVYLIDNDLIHMVYKKWRENLDNPKNEMDRDAEEFQETIDDLLDLSAASKTWYVPEGSGVTRLSFDITDNQLRIFNCDNFSEPEKLKQIGIINRAK